MQTDDLIDDLRAARDELFEALEAVGGDSIGDQHLVGEWGARELVAHLGYWSGHAAELIHAIEEGRSPDWKEGSAVDEVNVTVARVARQTDLATVRRREAASVEALVERLRAVDPELLAATMPDAASLELAIRADGPEHYGEHADQLRRPTEGHRHG